MASTALLNEFANSFRTLLFCVGAAYLSAMLTGCDGGTTGTTSSQAPPPPAEVDHDHGAAGHEHSHGEHEHPAPKTFAEAVDRVESLRNQIRDAFGKNDSEAAHGPLHDVGHALEAIIGLADSAGLDAKQKETVKASVELLMGQFSKVDEMMHGGKGTKYDDVASKIDEAVKTLVDLSSIKKQP